MKNQATKQATKTTVDYSELSEGQLKAIALMMHLGEQFIVDGDKVKRWDSVDVPEKDLEEVEPIEDSAEERDGHIVLTDEEADSLAKAYILDSVWVFNADFLAAETGHDYEVFKAIQENGRCEDNNSAILALIDDEQSFIDSAISADGRGHFLNTYDGQENEQRVDGITYYIYRMN